MTDETERQGGLGSRGAPNLQGRCAPRSPSGSRLLRGPHPTVHCLLATGQSYLPARHQIEVSESATVLQDAGFLLAPCRLFSRRRGRSVQSKAAHCPALQSRAFLKVHGSPCAQHPENCSAETAGGQRGGERHRMDPDGPALACGQETPPQTPHEPQAGCSVKRTFVHFSPSQDLRVP